MGGWQEKKDVQWSWLILCASFLTQMIALGTVLSFGIYFIILRDHFRCSRQEIAGVGGAAYGMLCITGPVAGLLYRKYGSRSVVITGGLVSSFGLFLSSFCTDLWQLYLTYGLITGIGFGLTYTPSIGVLTDYFEKYRFFATAFASIGAAVGTFILSPLLVRIIDLYHWRGSMLINAGLALQLVVCGSAMKSRSTQKSVDFSTLIEASLLKNGKFLLLCFHGFLIGGVCFVVFAMAGSLAISRGLSLPTAAILVSIMSACNGIGRCIASVIGHCPCTNRLLFFTITTGFVGLAALAVSGCYEFVAFAFVLTWFGLSFGMMFSQMPVVAIELFGPEKLVNAVGYFVCAVGLGGLSIPPLAGWLVDHTSIPYTAFLLAGVAGLLACGISTLVFLIRLKQRHSHHPVVLESVVNTESVYTSSLEHARQLRTRIPVK